MLSVSSRYATQQQLQILQEQLFATHNEVVAQQQGLEQLQILLLNSLRQGCSFMQQNEIKMQGRESQMSLEEDFNESLSWQNQSKEKAGDQSLAQISAAAVSASITEARLTQRREVQQQMGAADSLSFMGQAPSKVCLNDACERITECEAKQLVAHNQDITPLMQDVQERIAKCESRLLSIMTHGEDSQTVKAAPEDASKMIQAAVEIEISKKLKDPIYRTMVLESMPEVSMQVQNLVQRVTVLEACADTAPDMKESVGCNLEEEHTKEQKVSNTHTLDVEQQVSNTHALVLEELLEITQEHCTRSLSETTWEAAILVNLNGTGVAGSACIVSGLVCNILVQTVFLLVLFTSFIKNDLPDAEDIWEWRETQGHAWSNMIEAKSTSLVRAICAEDHTLIIATLQFQLYGEVSDYLSGDDQVGISLGALLAAMVLFQWALSIGNELADIYAIANAVSLLPKATRSMLHVQPDGLFAISCSLERVIIMLTLSLVRLIIAALLLVLGSIWLANTFSVQDLVLNAGALVFVLEMDELIFESLSPMAVKVLVRNLKPLEVPLKTGWKAYMKSPLTLLSAVTVVLLMFITNVLPNIGRMKDISLAFCHGMKDFVTQRHPLGLELATETDTMHNSGQILNSPSRLAVRNVLESSDIFNSKLVFGLASYREFLTAARQDNADLVDVITSQMMGMIGCEDYDFSADRVPQLTDMLSLWYRKTVASCIDLVDHCSGKELVRMACPVTCGCNDLHSGLLLSGPNQGCPSVCRKSSTYMGKLASMPCVDFNASELARMNGWTAFLSSWAEMWVLAYPSAASEYQQLIQDFSSHGCEALLDVPQQVQAQLCSPTMDISSINPFCPVSCGCGAYNTYLSTPPADCPVQCF